MITPSKAIATLPILIERIDSMRQEIGRATASATTQWDGLGRIGGQRDDHAAALLAEHVKPSIAALRAFLQRVETQMAEMQRDPFAETVIANR